MRFDSANSLGAALLALFAVAVSVASAAAQHSSIGIVVQPGTIAGFDRMPKELRRTPGFPALAIPAGIRFTRVLAGEAQLSELPPLTEFPTLEARGEALAQLARGALEWVTVTGDNPVPLGTVLLQRCDAAFAETAVIEPYVRAMNGFTEGEIEVEPGTVLALPCDLAKGSPYAPLADFASLKGLKLRGMEGVTASLDLERLTEDLAALSLQAPDSPDDAAPTVSMVETAFNETNREQLNQEVVALPRPLLSVAPTAQVASAAECQGAESDEATIVDPAALAARYEFEVAALEASYASRTALSKPDEVVVGVVDTGLHRVADSFFDERFFAVNIDERDGGGADDDNNGFHDDVFGIRATHAVSGDIEPVRYGADAAHGTKMAALVLGGPSLAHDFTMTETNSRIGLVVVNVNAGDDFQKAKIFGHHVGLAIKYLADRDVDIVNMSLMLTGEPFPSVDSRTVFAKHRKDMLFVVAAGNAEQGQGRDLATSWIVPARLGGVASPNIVTVGAHDLSGAPAFFSHYSATRVDLFAPGCYVPTRGYDDGSTVYDHGTSPAAAVVSFTAALVRSLRVTDPFEIKRRLIAGTTYEPRLEGKAFAAGRLDILKAISVHHDVVSNISGVPVAYGRLVAPAKLFDLCGTELPDRKDDGSRPYVLWKVDRLDPGGRRWRLTFEYTVQGDDGAPASIVCDVADPTAVKVQIDVVEGDRGPGLATLSLDEIGDLVLASRRKS